MEKQITRASLYTLHIYILFAGRLQIAVSNHRSYFIEFLFWCSFCAREFEFISARSLSLSKLFQMECTTAIRISALCCTLNINSAHDATARRRRRVLLVELYVFDEIKKNHPCFLYAYIYLAAATNIFINGLRRRSRSVSGGLAHVYAFQYMN